MPTREQLQAQALENGAEPIDLFLFDFQALADKLDTKEQLVYFGMAGYDGALYRCIGTWFRTLLYTTDGTLVHEWTHRRTRTGELEFSEGGLHKLSFISQGQRIALYLYPTRPRKKQEQRDG